MTQGYPSHQLVIGSLSVEVTVKPIKNLHLSVVPPHGSVRISAPEGMSPDHVRAYAIGKLSWIRRQQARLTRQQRESPRQVVERESHHLWGRRLLLQIQETETPPRVEAHPRKLVLFIRPGTTTNKRQSILNNWYREELRREAHAFLSKWEKRLNVKSNALFLQLMTRRWGSCNPVSKNIRINTQLVHKPTACLEYVILHELTHLVISNHGQEFKAILDEALPDWEARRQLLNSLPIVSVPGNRGYDQQKVNSHCEIRL